MRYLFLMLLCAVMIFSCSGIKNADLVIHNGKILTVDQEFSVKEAVAVKGDKIIFVGSNEEVQRFIGQTTDIIDVEGKIVLPGLIDAHGHFASYGAFLGNLDLNGTTSYRQILDMVAERVAQVHRGEWILGRGWDQNNWKNKNFPTHGLLSKVAPENPVLLTRTCGHAVLVNKKALEIAGIDKTTPDPPGGKILYKKNGQPSGILIDEAENLVGAFIPELTTDGLKQNIINAAENCLSVGLTGMHDAGIPPEQIAVYKELVDEAKLDVRIYAMVSDPGPDSDIEAYLKKHKIEKYGDYMFSVKCVKLFADGSLGARSAAMIDPYSDDPDNSGVIVSDKDHIYNVALAALNTGMQVATHAIGDRAVRNVLDGYEKAIIEKSAADHRFRIEHSQIVAKEDLPRYAPLGILPSMQPASAVSDMDWTEARVGKERIWGAYAWRRFIDSECIIPCSSDFPVESNNPLLGMYRAITRQDEDGTPDGGWLPDQRMTIEEAIKGFTIWAATAAFQEDLLGSIEKGKLADFTILDKDILEIAPEELITTQVLYTIVGGKVVFQSNL